MALQTELDRFLIPYYTMEDPRRHGENGETTDSSLLYYIKKDTVYTVIQDKADEFRIRVVTWIVSYIVKAAQSFDGVIVTTVP